MRGRRIYRGFVLKYIVFLISAVIIVILSIAFMGWNLQQAFEQGEIPGIIADLLVQTPPEETDFGDIRAMGGWIQVLDENWQVVYQAGKNPPINEKYQPEEILSHLGRNYSDKYFYSVAYYPDGSENKLLLTAIPADKMTVEYKPENAPFSVIKPFVLSVVKAGILFLVLISINILFYSYYTTNTLRKPLGILLKGIEKMSKGERDVRINLETGNELEEIGTAFNQMSFQLEEALQEKEEENLKRRQLIADISHDLKTPLASIRGYVEGLVDGVIQHNKADRYLQLIKEKTIKIDDLLTRLFQLSKLDRGDYRFQFEDSDLTEFCRVWFGHYIPEMEEQGFDYQVQIPDERIRYSFDKKELERALTNILLNGIKYNPPGTIIFFKLEQVNQEIIIEIGDNGVGIDSIYKDRIFEPFCRGDSSRSSKMGGTGLGLTIAQRIIEKHSGHIELESQKGEGTIFKIRLPH